MENPEKNQSQEVKKDEPSSKKRPLPSSFGLGKASSFRSFGWLVLSDCPRPIDQVAGDAQHRNRPRARAWMLQGNVSAYGNTVTLIPGFLYIICALNQGSAFSVGASVNWMRYVFIVISWGASYRMLWYWYKHLNKHDNLMNSILMLCFAGAVRERDRSDLLLE
jgi:hypothetical protein